jgi:hypothetical protein
MPTTPDDPTRRPAPYAPIENGTWLEELRDQVRSLRTAVVLLGILLVVTLGIAAWALLANQDDSGSTTRRGASPARVAKLEDRVSALESRVRDAPSKGDLADLTAQQKVLDGRLDALEKASDDAASQQSVDQVQQDLEDLQKRVDQIEQQQQDQTATP